MIHLRSRKLELLGTLTNALESYDKGGIDPNQLGAVFEQLQSYLEAEVEADSDEQPTSGMCISAWPVIGCAQP